MNKPNDSRYPYTYADDYIRGFGGYDKGGVRLSRSDASQILKAISVALGMSHEDLASKLADYYLANEKQITEDSVAKLMRAIKF